MSATAQMTRPKQEQGNWTNIFPAEQVTETQSALFVKKLLAVAVSNITYLRAIFPEHAFGDRCLEDLNLKILRDDSACPGACQVIKWVKGCFDALEKKYLKMLVIGIYTNPDEPDTVIESYTFKFNYDHNSGVDIYRNNKRISEKFSAAETKKATIRLLRTIVVLTQSLASLPENVMMTMKLTYYDDVTPEDYEPPGFTAADNENFNFDEEPMNIKVGDVQTPFHTVKLRIKTDGKQFQSAEEVEKFAAEDSESINASQNIAEPGLDQDENAQMGDDETTSSQVSHTSHTQVVPEPAEGDVPSVDTPAKPSPGDEAVDTAGSQYGGSQYGGSQATDNQEDLGVRCPCGNNEDDGLMVICDKCRYWQHGVCFKIVEEEDAPIKHICNLCGNPSDEDRLPTDPQLCNMNEVAVQAMCLWRRALMACTETERVLGPSFSRRLGVEMTVGTGLINRLVKEGFLKNPAKGKKQGKVVDVDRLKEGLGKYFKKPEKQEEAEEESQNNENSQMDVEVQIVDKKPTGKGSKNVDCEVDHLISRAEDINLDGRRKKATPRKDDTETEMSQAKGRGRGKKRSVKSMADSEEFELSNSQDVSQSQDIIYETSGKARGKRRKASQARKAILV